MGLLDANYSTVNAGKPRKSDRILPGEQMNVRGLLDAATNIPVVGDALSGGMAVYDAANGDYGSAAMNALGVIPGVSAGMLGMLKPGKYPAHGWNIRGEELKSAINDTSGLIPEGVPETHQEGVFSLIEKIKNSGLLPFTDVDKGGSVYVSAFNPVKKSNGEISMAKKPVTFGKEWSEGYRYGKENFQARFADHGQYYSGPTLSIDPLSGNSPDTAQKMLEYFLGESPKRPQTGKSYIIPATGEQGGFK